MATAYHVPFPAPVARGHGVLVVVFALAGEDATMVLDRATVKLAVDGVCAGTITSTKGWHHRYGTSTVVLMEAAPAPYR